MTSPLRVGTRFNRAESNKKGLTAVLTATIVATYCWLVFSHKVHRFSFSKEWLKRGYFRGLESLKDQSASLGLRLMRPNQELCR